MKKLESNFINMVLALLLITGVAAAALGAVYKATEQPIALTKAAKQQAAIKSVVPPFDNDPMAEEKKYAVDGDTIRVFPAKMSGKEVGYAIETFTNSGFSGLIRIMVGVDIEGSIVNYSVLEHKETPGLGTKMQEWFMPVEKTPSLLTKLGLSLGWVKEDDKAEAASTGGTFTNIIGINPAEVNLKVSKDGGDIDAITAATISSRAFLDAINRGITTQKANSADAYSGATSTDAESGATATQDSTTVH